MCRIALAPRLWLQGAWLTTTGGSGSSKQAATWAAGAPVRGLRDGLVPAPPAHPGPAPPPRGGRDSTRPQEAPRGGGGGAPGGVDRTPPRLGPPAARPPAAGAHSADPVSRSA